MIHSTIITIQIVRALTIFANIKVIVANYNSSVNVDYSQATSSKNIGHRVASTDDNDDSVVENILKFSLRILFLLLGAFAILFGSILMLYILHCICDKICCCCRLLSDNDDDNDNNSNAAETTIGPIAGKAQLLGLTYGERQSILQHIFQQKVYNENEHEVTKYHKNNRKLNEIYKLESEQERDIETGVTENTSQNDTRREAEDERPEQQQSKATNVKLDVVNPVECSDNYQIDVESVKLKENTKIGNDGCNFDGIAKEYTIRETTCAICLLDYEEGDSVLTVSQCSHVFHFECAMEWFRDHDSCPCCRKEIMTPIVMRQAALEVLGRERYKQACSCSPVTKNNNEVGATSTMLYSNNHHRINTRFNNDDSDAATLDLTETSIDTLPELFLQPPESILMETQNTSSFSPSAESRLAEI